MKNAWFVLCLLASILIHAAIIDSARLEPLPPVTGTQTAAPAIEARDPAQPPPPVEARGGLQPPLPVESPARTSVAIGGEAGARGEHDQPELPAIDSGSSYAHWR